VKNLRLLQRLTLVILIQKKHAPQSVSIDVGVHQALMSLSNLFNLQSVTFGSIQGLMIEDKTLEPALLIIPKLKNLKKFKLWISRNSNDDEIFERKTKLMCQRYKIKYPEW